MHLNKLILKNFKKYRNAEIVFQDGLTGIIGGNGSGKSTIVEAIAWALYGSRASTIRRELIKNASAGPNDPVEVELSLTVGSRELSIYRAIRGRTNQADAYLLLDGRKIASGTKEVELQLERMIKISFQDFMRTFYARQKDLDNLLREGGSGKREYLLKLLGLDEVREAALSQIKADLRVAQDASNQLEGALREIGDVEKRIYDVSKDIVLAKRALEESQEAGSALMQGLEKKKLAVEVESERQRRHELLHASLLRMEEEWRRSHQEAETEERRLHDMEAARRELDRLATDLACLAEVRRTLESLEQKKKSYDQLLSQKHSLDADAAALSRIIAEGEQRLCALQNDLEELNRLETAEMEYASLCALTTELDKRRDRFNELSEGLASWTSHQKSALKNLKLATDELEDLNQAALRLDEIAPDKERLDELQRILSGLLEQRERHRDLDRLKRRRAELMPKRSGCHSRMEALSREISSLKDPDSMWEKVQQQDRELDMLSSELNNRISELRSYEGIEDARIREAQRHLSHLKSLGADTSCPTCERTLGAQYTVLVEKYGAEVALASEKKANLQAERARQEACRQGVLKDRSGLKSVFDRINGDRAAKAALEAQSIDLQRQIQEVEQEIEAIDKEIASIGPVDYNLQVHAKLEQEANDLKPIAQEHAALAARIVDIPKRSSIVLEFQADAQKASCRIEEISQEIADLGYDRSQHEDVKKSELLQRRVHERYCLLSQSFAQIHVVEKKVSSHKDELKSLTTSAQDVAKKMSALGFDPLVHESLTAKMRSMIPIEALANDLRLASAGEDEARARLLRAKEALSSLTAEIQASRDGITKIGYSSEAHDVAKKALSDAHDELEEFKERIYESRERLGKLTWEHKRLVGELQRKAEHEAKLSSLRRRIQMVETARGLINSFLDGILIRIRKEIAYTAGDILEMVTGRYSLIRIDDDFNIEVEDRGEFYPIARYSGGEIDMIAVSVRVAISEYLMRFSGDWEGYSFMILDEIFGSQDIEHRERMINMLRRLEQRFPQIFAISHISDVQGQFDNTITVIEDGTGNSYVELG